MRTGGVGVCIVSFMLLRLCVSPLAASAAEPDLILHHGKIVTVDRGFTIHQAISITGDRITAVGGNEEILRARGPRTEVVDLEGKMALPGLIDSHVHATGAAMTEFDHVIPEMESISDVLRYIRARAEAMGEGQWVCLRQVFITRLREQRYPTRAELDEAAPRNPVLFSTGPDASVNTPALKLSGIDKDFRVNDGGQGFIEKDPVTGEPTGILRNCTRYVKYQEATREPAEEDRRQRLVKLFADYNAVGLTTISDRSADAVAVERFRALRDGGQLSVRMSLCYYIDTIGPLEAILEKIRAVASHPLRQDDPMLRIVGVKTFLDGGMLTGSAYMLQPWGVSKTYAISDSAYRGVLFIPKERLLPMVRAAVESNLQFNAHSVGDGAVLTLLEVYDEINKTLPVKGTRPCLAHANFMSREAVDLLARLGAVVDVQPAWLYLDTRTLAGQFGYDRLRYFQPLRTIFERGIVAGGGSDHMQKIGSLRSINPYNPFLGMWTAITRKARWFDGPLHPEQSLTREQAIRLYTTNNAYILFREHQIGSLEAGKLADLIVLDRDLLTCPEDEIREAQVLRTYFGGRRIFSRD